jgi:hypothetical protein
MHQGSWFATVRKKRRAGASTPARLSKTQSTNRKEQIMSQASGTITRRQRCQKELLEIINSNQACQSAEIARLERWAKEFHREPPVVEVPVVDHNGLPTGETVELSSYKVKAFERFCEKRGLDPGNFLNDIAKTVLPLLVKSKEAREAFFKGTSEFVAWLRHAPPGISGV